MLILATGSFKQPVNPWGWGLQNHRLWKKQRERESFLSIPFFISRERREGLSLCSSFFFILHTSFFMLHSSFFFCSLSHELQAKAKAPWIVCLRPWLYEKYHEMHATVYGYIYIYIHTYSYTIHTHYTYV